MRSPSTASSEDPVELVVNDRRFGTGELVSTGGHRAVRITELTAVKAAHG